MNAENQKKIDLFLDKNYIRNKAKNKALQLFEFPEQIVIDTFLTNKKLILKKLDQNLKDFIPL